MAIENLIGPKEKLGKIKSANNKYSVYLPKSPTINFYLLLIAETNSSEIRTADEL